MFDINKATDEQKEILNQKDKNILVSAAAGSGKTTVMIERIARLIILNKVPINEFLIITFTKASAEDMKNKLINRLSAESPTPHLLSQIDNIPVSDVSNLHSFCARLLKSYFYVVGLDPTFSVIDDVEQNRLKSRALDKLFEEESKVGDKQFFDLVDILSTNRKDSKLREQILKMFEFSKAVYNFDAWFNESKNNAYCLDLDKNKCAKIIKNYAKNIIFIYQDEIAELKTLINNECSIEKDKKGLISYLDMIDSKIKAINVREDFEKFSLSVKENRNFSKICSVDEQSVFFQNKCKELKKTLKERIDTIYDALFDSPDDTIETLKDALISVKEKVETLYDLYLKFDKIYMSIKKDLGVLDFNDLEGYTLKVLNDEKTLQEIKSKYKYVFVDEYQDINTCQEEIISRISSHNNRFMVGDIKQSIYGFRLCDPDIFLEKYNNYKMGEKDSVGISLNKNFRSHADILEFVNIIFDDTMTKSFGGVEYKIDGRLVPGKENNKPEENKRTSIMFMNTSGMKKEDEKTIGHLDVYSVKNHNFFDTDDTKKAYLEGLMISNKIAELVSSNYMIEDKESHKLRHIEYKDIVLLVQSRNEYLNNLLDVLDSFAIPISSDIATDVFEDEDILSIKNLLLIISNFNQDKPLFSVMYSSLFNFTPDELATIRLNTNERYFYDSVRNYPNENSELYYKILEFISKIQTYKKLSKFLSVKDLCYRIISDFNIETYFLSCGNSSERLTKLNKFVSSLSDELLDEYLLDGDISSITCESKTATDSVKVMTIHKSKGLEFPVVFLIGTGNKFNMRSVVGDLVISKELGATLNYFNIDERYKNLSLPRAASKIVENKKFYEEQQRLLYVALTRAINYLFITAAIDEDDIKEKFTSTPTRFFDWFSPIVKNPEKHKDFFTIVEYDAKDFEKFNKVKDDKTIFVGSYNHNDFERIKNNINYIYPYEKLTAIPQKTSVTKIVSQNSPKIIHKNSGIASNNNQADRGTAIHSVLEKLTLLENKPEEVNNIINKLLKTRALTSYESELINVDAILKSINNSQFRALIESADDIKKEAEFYMLYGDEENPQDKTTVQGIVDLLLVINNEIVIVDYKTGSLNEYDAKLKYSKQLELYSLAIEKIYNKPVKAKYILAIDEQKLFNI